MPCVVVGGPLRLFTAFLCFVAALALAGLGLDLGWGIGWMAFIPALFLLLPAMALAQRRELRRAPEGLELHQGWLFRRIWVIPLAGAELEVLPAGGAWAVILHRGDRELPLATWVRRGTAERVAALLSELPRRPSRRPAGDR